MSREKNQPGIEKSRVMDIGEMAAYNEGAIVSRTLAESEAGTVTLFSFDEGQGLSEHAAPFDALVQVVDGRGEFTIDGHRHEVGAGQLIVMPAGVPHSVRAPVRFRMILTMLRRQARSRAAETGTALR